MFETLKKKFPEEGNRCLKNCGKCCVNGVPLGKEEAESIGNWLIQNRTYEEIKAQFEHFDDQPDRCPFLAPDKSCFIYPARPVVCVMFGHLADTPGMPAKVSQQCTEGVKFTQIETEDTLPESLDWFIITGRTMGRIMSFRTCELITETGEAVKIPIKPNSKMERLVNAKNCFRCNAPFVKDAYLESGELLCKKCEDAYVPESCRSWSRAS